MIGHQYGRVSSQEPCNLGTLVPRNKHAEFLLLEKLLVKLDIGKEIIAIADVAAMSQSLECVPRIVAARIV